jgi:8-oxo-dGTP pyrophosphatase MutT (NUDIX family)
MDEKTIKSALHPAEPVKEGVVWRPPDNIRAKVIGIAQHETRLLVCEVLNDHGILKGWIPLGGGIEFGETAEEALKREIVEELGCDILITGTPMTYENIFEHYGAKGHEIILALTIKFKDPQIYSIERFQIRESSGSLHWVEWIDIECFKSGEAILFPTALAQQIF